MPDSYSRSCSPSNLFFLFGIKRNPRVRHFVRLIQISISRQRKKSSQRTRNLVSQTLGMMIRAIRVSKFGGPQVLKIEQIERPKVSPSGILVKIVSAGINPVDTYIREGAFLNLPDLPYIPGKDGAGLVEAVGESVKNFKVGDRVFMCKKTVSSHGTYAEYTVGDVDTVFPLADRLTFDQGAAIGIPYFTAYRALVLKAKCSPGETVLVHGASGAVGLATVQLGKNCGLKVIGTAGTAEGLAAVKENGADHVLCHRDKNYTEKIMEITEDKGVDIIIEMLANVNLDKDLDMVAKKGRIAIVGSRGPIKIDPRKMMGPEIQVVGVALLSSTQEEWQQTTQSILKGIDSGWVKPVIDKKYSLEDASEAHKDIINSSGAKGKIVISVAEQ